jgi:hypothetical protein
MIAASGSEYSQTPRGLVPVLPWGCLSTSLPPLAPTLVRFKSRVERGVVCVVCVVCVWGPWGGVGGQGGSGAHVRVPVTAWGLWWDPPP